MNHDSVYSVRLLDPFVKLITTRYQHVDLSEVYAHAHIMPWEIADTSHWLSQKQVNRFIEKAIELTGAPGLAREAGQFLARPDSFGPMRGFILSFVTPHKVFERIGDVIPRLTKSSFYKSQWISTNSFSITVTPFPGIHEELYQCENRIGIFEAVLRNFNYKHFNIVHDQCIFRGGDACHYVISWEKAVWNKIRMLRHYTIAFFLPAVLSLALYDSRTLYFGVPTLLLLHFLLKFYETEQKYKEALFGLESLNDSRDQLLELLDTNYDNAQLTSDIGQVISKHTSVDAILSELVKVLQRRLDFDRGMILLSDSQKENLYFKAGFGHLDKETRVLQKATFSLNNPNSRGVFVRSFHEQVPLLVDDFEEFQKKHTTKSIDIAKSLGVKSFVCCPIICDGESIGVLAVDNLKTSRKLMQSDKSLLMGIAPILGVSIRNAELLLSKEREFQSTLQVLAASIDARDPLTAGHSEKVTEYAVGICCELGLPDDVRECVRVAALLHDYGKIGVPDSILKKPGRLTVEEYEIIKTHSSQTRDILDRISFDGRYKDVPKIAGFHHERWNGTGYPDGLRGEEIPIGSRIIAVADHFEAITAKRHYRDPMPTSVAIDEIVRHTDTFYDPVIVNAFVNYYRRLCSTDLNASGKVCRLRQRRVNVSMSALVSANDKVFVGKVIDLSKGGIYVALPEDLMLGQHVKIELLHPNTQRHMFTNGRVAWLNSRIDLTKSSYPSGCGIEFIGFDGSAYDEIIDIFDSSLSDSISA